ncbi:bifunctional non-homologous end joining protein LigD [Pedococcus cremeus]|uniref:DNA ligase (ATP) n=1 Tax=Pedococcus cremeus TaxID=587636 RepID=A0A1H9THQ0_9MICO|nr:non-homologous end-joining DNA ligase [Pedococcus cremeus]SER96648.1 bifunctional non-homologous end joining protein LigD [Pedococcus cremeus]
MPEHPLDRYRSKRDAARTREPVPPPGPLPHGKNDVFVVQEHHASALHWDFRLERDGVLVSWAVPKGLPLDPHSNRLAVPTEDHPVEYADFEGDIAEGEYGGGRVVLWDRGTYETEKWDDHEVKVVLHGSRVEGRYVLFRTGDRAWMMHRVSPPPTGWQPLPDRVAPMMATLRDSLPPDDDQWGFEMKWDGVRAVVFVDGGRPRAVSRNDIDITASYPELRAMAEAMGATQAVMDGELVALDESGRPSFERLQARMHVQGEARVRRLMGSVPVTFLVFDLLHLDGRSTLDLPYRRRRELLDSLDLNGPSWRTPPAWFGDGPSVLAASTEQGLEGVVAKRLDSVYRPGRRADTWVKVKNLRTQEVVVGGWKPGEGRREGSIGSLLLGIPSDDGLRYAGKVGTGFTQSSLRELHRLLAPLEVGTTPFTGTVPAADARQAHWVSPEVVGEVRFAEWTRDGRLRHPAWRDLRPDKSARDVVRES